MERWAHGMVHGTIRVMLNITKLWRSGESEANRTFHRAEVEVSAKFIFRGQSRADAGTLVRRHPAHDRPPLQRAAGSCGQRRQPELEALRLKTASSMLHQFTRWLRGMPVDRDVSLNLLASELAVI